jgi:hypothetical protein
MTQDELSIRGIEIIDRGRVAVLVDPPDGLDLQYIYRAALSVYWNPAKRRLEDRYAREDSPASSYRRIARALEDEYGLRLRADPHLRWIDVAEDVQREIECELRKSSC